MITQNEISSLNLSPTKKDFVQIWNELIEVASKITERWDPTSTNESDPGIVLLKVLAGIADKLNYNIDKNILEAYMPTAAQIESMRKLCELVGYDIKYYQSAETRVRISYTGNTAPGEDNEEKLPAGGLALPKFTTITNADKDITFVTTNTIPVLITNDTPWIEVPCIEGQISQCESVNDNNLITLAQLDDENRYYLPEIQIAENGIFVYNAITEADNTFTDNTPWTRVSNLNTQPAETRVFKFGYDSFEGRPYIAFPADIGSLIGDGLFIYFVRTSGLSGNISPRTLEVLELPAGDDWGNYSAEKFEVVNVDATTNGANIENISTAYNNFKKTVGTFDTLVTCRDYMNKIYSLMNASNLPYVSNVLVTDIRNDINKAVTLCSCDEYGILYKETPITETIPGSSFIRVEDTGKPNVSKYIVKTATSTATEKPLIDHFDLLLYPFKTFTQVSSGTKDLVGPYNKSFTYTEQMNREIEAALADFKTCAHNLKAPDTGDIVAINNYLRLNALIATSTKVTEAEATAILQNVKVALVNEFNLRNLDFGEEIPFDSILSVIENADSRIKVVSLQEPTVLTTYSIKEESSNGATSNEYGIVATASDGKIAKIDGVKYIDESGNYYVIKKDENGNNITVQDIYNKLVLRNILAGRASLFDYDETFIPNNAEKPYTATKDITAELNTRPDGDEVVNKIKNAVTALVNNMDIATGEYILYDDTNVLIRNGFYSSNSILTLKIFDEDITKKLEDILKDDTHPKYSIAESVYALVKECEEKETVGEYNFTNTGLSNGTITVITSESTSTKVYEKRIFEIYETYEPSFTSEGVGPGVTAAGLARKNTATVNNGIINDIKRVEAVCEIQNTENTFKNITLSKNEVIKFRAPNLITTKTFPAYVYYRFERGTQTMSLREDMADGVADKNVDGSFAQAMSLSDFINQDKVGTTKFFGELWQKAGVSFDNESYTFEAEATDPVNPKIPVGGRLADIFNTAIAVEVDPKAQLQAKKKDPVTNLPIEPVEYVPYAGPRIFIKLSDFTDVITEHFSNSKNKDSIKFRYYPLTYHTSSIWGDCIKNISANIGKKLPSGNVLWKLSSTSSYPKGKLVLESGKKLIGLDGDSLALGNVGELVYICTNLGLNPDHYALSENSDIELRKGDKLYIHYTPSSTNEDGETTNAEPISIVYEGGDKDNPIIIKPSGFSLIDSDAVYRQGTTSWKKTDVDFGKHGKKNLLALAPNEQIELRSISKVVLNTTARFYRNFDAKQLDGNINEVETYELKDGEYIFYTDRNTQEAAYYGSGSVITLDKGAFIPKAKEPVEVSEILTQGLHIIPWSDDVFLSDTRKITITEYQYVTLVEGDTLNTLTVDQGTASDSSYVINSTDWAKCLSTEDSPIIYTPSGSETSITLPRVDLRSGPSTSWEVSSFLELSTSPGYPQQLRMADIKQNDVDSNTVSIKNKVKVYTDAKADAKPVLIIEPATALDPVSFKLSTIVQTASGNFEKTDSDLEDDIDDSTMQMKVFKEELPKFIELRTNEEQLTPVSSKQYSLAETTAANLSNYWTKLEISGQLSKPEAETAVAALSLNFMIPEDTDVFGIFSIYLDVPEDKLESSSYNIPKSGSRIFIDIPKEYGSFDANESMENTIISIFNCKTLNTQNDCSWWPDGIANSNRLYLRAGLNCIRVNKSCNLLIKADKDAMGSLLYDNMRLVRGRETHGINLALLNPKAIFNTLTETTDVEKKAKAGLAKQLAKDILNNLAKLDKNHDFYYNVPIENSLAIEFDRNIDSFSNPYTLYDINNINNDFVISKLDVKYLKDGLKIAKSSKY